MLRKALAFLLVVAFTMTMLAGCGSTPVAPTETKAAQVQETQKQEPAKADVKKEPVTIRVLGCTGVFDKMEAAVVSKCEAEGVKIEYETYDWNTYDGKQKMAMTAGGGDYDVVLLPGNYIQTWAQAKALKPVDDIMKKVNIDTADIYDSVKTFAVADGKWMGVPHLAESLIFYYRTDLYEKAGVQAPKSIDEMYETAKKLTKDGVFGLAYPGGPEEGSCSFWSYFLWSYGGTYFDKGWKPQISTPEAIKSAEMFSKILKECAPKGVTAWQNEETVGAFGSGNVAAMIMWPSFYSTLQDASKSKVAGKIAVAPVPAGPTGKACPRFGTWGTCIPVNSKKDDAATTFIKYYCGKEGQAELCKATSSPFKSINADKALQAANPTLAASAGALNDAQERPAIPESAQYIPLVGNAINSITAGKDAKSTLEEANKKLDDIMKKAGYYK